MASEMLQRMRVIKCPTAELSVTNKAIVNVADFTDEVKYADISPGPGQHYKFALEKIADLPRGHVGFTLVQRKWATLTIDQEIHVRPYRFDANSDIITQVSFETDFLQKNTITQEPYDSDEMAKEFILHFSGMALTVGQTLVFHFKDKKLLGLAVKTLEAIDPRTVGDGKEAKARNVRFGRILGNTVVQFEKAENSELNFT